MAVHKTSDSDDNQQITVLKPEHFGKVAATMMEFNNPLEDCIKWASVWEAEVLEGLEKMKREGILIRV